MDMNPDKSSPDSFGLCLDRLFWTGVQKGQSLAVAEVGC